VGNSAWGIPRDLVELSVARTSDLNTVSRSVPIVRSTPGGSMIHRPARAPRPPARNPRNHAACGVIFC